MTSCRCHLHRGDGEPWRGACEHRDASLGAAGDLRGRLEQLPHLCPQPCSCSLISRQAHPIQPLARSPLRKELIYVAQVLDAALYIFLPQLAILLSLSTPNTMTCWSMPRPFFERNVLRIRLLQRRPLLHRMSGRTVVIGDVPWVAGSTWKGVVGSGV